MEKTHIKVQGAGYRVQDAGLSSLRAHHCHVPSNCKHGNAIWRDNVEALSPQQSSEQGVLASFNAQHASKQLHKASHNKMLCNAFHCTPRRITAPHSTVSQCDCHTMPCYTTPHQQPHPMTHHATTHATNCHKQYIMPQPTTPHLASPVHKTIHHTLPDHAAPHGTRHSTAQNRTAQHGTAHNSTPQHTTAQDTAHHIT